MAKLKRLLAPQFWKIPKKIRKWTVSPSPGPHKKFECIPLLILVRDILKLAETGKEAKSLIKKGEIWVDGKPRKDHAYPAGLMDVVSIPKLNKNYRITVSEKGLELIEIPEEESKLKLLRIKGKRVVKKGKIQLNFHDGKNLLVEENVYKTGDSLLVELPSLKIIQHLKLEKNVCGLVLKGKNAGKIGKVIEIIIPRNEPRKIICEIEGKKAEVLFDYFFVVGKEAPVIKLGEKIE
ncbi:MAG: 30S ribosomal protein S4e [Candidatus Aenigmatarchaeota archaeon]